MATPLLDLAARRGVAFPLRTERLTLTPFTAVDAPAVWDFCRLEEVRTWTSGRAGSAAELREEYLATGDRLTVRDGAGDVVGVGKLAVQDAWSQGGPHPDARDAQAELGWTVAPEHAGRGYATEIGRALLDLAFRGLGVRRVEAGAFADNAPSLRVMAKIGLRHEGTFLGESLHLTRGWIDGVTFALLASEYEGGAAASRA
ncbi:GNAT family N-acetyltransferase [Micrococcus porci]|uniref:GNAT family N-acetyltransferase n=1 Tax=Micrococcus porci TaxID=2856555 RepID=UPI001CCDEEF2|nr:GNAT family N-acetyltransferase [Micrococcus porci]UBH25010.1 GNAT family N-acetyltransferase [Micrococcus porci]